MDEHKLLQDNILYGSYTGHSSCPTSNLTNASA